MNFDWKTLPKPFTVQAPMDGVTDTVFRQMVAHVHKPDVMMTEFVCVEGFQSKGRDRLLSTFHFSPKERPIIAQVWGVTPKYFYDVAKEIVAMGFDGIDINMGCPIQTVMKTGGGAALIDTPELAKEIIQATRKGIQESGSSIPLSVKTRIGNRKNVADMWVRFLLGLELDALTIHGRTAKEGFQGVCHWEEIQKIVELRNELNAVTIIIGNGDIFSYKQAKEFSIRYGVDGVMIGRGMLQNINCFDSSGKTLSQDELKTLLIRHLKLFSKTYGSQAHSYVLMKKYFRMYIRDFDGSAALRAQLMETQTPAEAVSILQKRAIHEAVSDMGVSQKSKV